MGREYESAAARYNIFACDVLAPAVIRERAPLSVSVLQSAEPLDPSDAVEREFRPVPIGWRWGPVWSTAWFQIRGVVPTSMAGKSVGLRFSSGTEATLWERGEPRCGLDPNHELVLLYEPARGGETVGLHVEAACNRPFGVAVFSWEDAEERRRWSEPMPGRLEFCELVVLDQPVWRLWKTYEFARQLLAQLGEESPRARRLAVALERATQRIDAADVPAAAAAATALVEEGLRGEAASTQTAVAIGHAHIDTAWLWPIRETRRKCIRSFSTVVALMERYPDFHFMCSQAQQYAWVEKDAPGLFARITARVREGRWEPCGGMWVEPDANLPSGESLVRQILHGVRYWRERFGEHAPQRILYLPDTFGFPASLPQIARLAGLDTFITNKLWWNDTNEFPHMTFVWRGLDGSEILAHNTPGKDYNSANTPREWLRGVQNAARIDPAGTGLWLQPFGFGDGGGGPTAETIHFAQLAGKTEGLPNVLQGRADRFAEALHRRRKELLTAGRDLPVWDGELYLEFHRGTYTTQAWLKRANRRAEGLLRIAEWLTFFGPQPLANSEAHEASLQLDKAWKQVLLHQFHDILPGSSIAQVYEHAHSDHERVRGVCEALIRSAARRWAAAAHSGGGRQPFLVLNSASTPRSGWVRCGERECFATDVPALGARVLDAAADTPAPQPVNCTADELSNGILAARFDELGRITSLRRLDLPRDACGSGSGAALNQLVLYEDRPRVYDAWEIDREYEQKAERVLTPCARRITGDGLQRGAIEFTRALGRDSRITQTYVLRAGSPRLDIQTRVEWRERHRLLRALFPVQVHARRATYEIQFGHLERATHRNTPWDQAMFEVCAHGWMDLSESGFGVALLNDCKYGHSCHGNVLGLSLLRGPTFPDPHADLGEHEFTYSLMPHDGDWRRAGVDKEAEDLNNPLQAHPLEPGGRGPIGEAWAPFELQSSGSQGVRVVAAKRGERGDALVLRLVETHGGRARVTLRWALPVTAVRSVDLLEHDHALEDFRHDARERVSSFAMQPFQIVTLAAK